MDLHVLGAGVRFDNAGAALLGIDLQIRAGERVGLVGPSGSGKSTLLRMLSLSLAPDEGQLRVDDRDPWQETSRARQVLRRRLHLCPQSGALPSRQRVAIAVLAGLLPVRSLWFALKTLMLPARADIALAHASLARLQMQACLWRDIESLSGGQRQRVAIARALVADVEALFVDEPLSALDPALAEQCLQVLVSQAGQKQQTLVCALHQIDLAREQLDRLIGLRDGRILFDRTAKAVNDDDVRALYRGYETELHV